MEIYIKQEKFTVNDEFKIFIDGDEKYSGFKDYKPISPIDIYELNNEKVKIRIRDHSWFKPRYSIYTWEAETTEFITTSFWKSYYTCSFLNDNYEIYRHSGKIYSIFKNGTQVAKINKIINFELVKRDSYKILLDDNCNVEIIISFCLIIDNILTGSNRDSFSNTILELLGQFKKDLNLNWKPNSK